MLEEGRGGATRRWRARATAAFLASALGLHPLVRAASARATSAPQQARSTASSPNSAGNGPRSRSWCGPTRRGCPRRTAGLVRGPRCELRHRRGLERAPRREDRAETGLAPRPQPAKRGRPARRFTEFLYATHASWSRTHRVVAKAEHLLGKSNPCLVVTSSQSLGPSRLRARLLPPQPDGERHQGAAARSVLEPDLRLGHCPPTSSGSSSAFASPPLRRPGPRHRHLDLRSHESVAFESNL